MLHITQGPGIGGSTKSHKIVNIASKETSSQFFLCLYDWSQPETVALLSFMADTGYGIGKQSNVLSSLLANKTKMVFVGEAEMGKFQVSMYSHN